MVLFNSWGIESNATKGNNCCFSCCYRCVSVFWQFPNSEPCKSNRHLFVFYTNDKTWAATCQNQQSDCAASEDSDQPGHPPRLIRVFDVRMKKAWVLSYPLSANRILWSDWADAQADLSLRWSHSHVVGFVILRLTSRLQNMTKKHRKQGRGMRELQNNMSPVKRICVFEHSVMTNFNCACPAIQRGQGSGFPSKGSSWLTASMSEQRRFWRDCTDAQARLNLRCSHRR